MPPEDEKTEKQEGAIDAVPPKVFPKKDNPFLHIYKELENEETNNKSAQRPILRTYRRWSPEPPKKIDDAVTEEAFIKNEGLRQDIKMKRMTLKTLFCFLASETIVIFLFAFFQAVKKPWSFALEEWSFKLLITATISQITVMLVIAVKHLFPNKKENYKN